MARRSSMILAANHSFSMHTYAIHPPHTHTHTFGPTFLRLFFLLCASFILHLSVLWSLLRTDALGASLVDDLAGKRVQRAHTRAQVALPRAAPLRAPARQQKPLLGDELRTIEGVGEIDLLALTKWSKHKSKRDEGKGFVWRWIQRASENANMQLSDWTAGSTLQEQGILLWPK
jgi:hypothetical protein